MSKQIASLSTLSILTLILLYYTKGSTVLAILLIGIACGAISTLLINLYSMLSSIEKVESNAPSQFQMRIHIGLHIVPLSFILLQFLTKPSFYINLLYFFPIMLFFFTGRITWEKLYKKFDSKMYKIFHKGNTGMLFGPTILLILDGLSNENFGSANYSRAVTAYFVIHFLLIGIAVLKIEKDFSTNKPKNIPTDRLHDLFSLKLVALIATISFLALLLIHFWGGTVILSLFLIGLGIGSIAILMIQLYTFVSRIERKKPCKTSQFKMRGHILLHIIPLSYLAVQFSARPSLYINSFYFIPIALFFMTGRLTWKKLYEQFGSKMYQLFYKGNTGMLVGLTILLIMGWLYDENFGIEYYSRVLIAYFMSHFLLVGVTVLKIEHDSRNE